MLPTVLRTLAQSLRLLLNSCQTPQSATAIYNRRWQLLNISPGYNVTHRGFRLLVVSSTSLAKEGR